MTPRGGTRWMGSGGSVHVDGRIETGGGDAIGGDDLVDGNVVVCLAFDGDIDLAADGFSVVAVSPDALFDAGMGEDVVRDAEALDDSEDCGGRVNPISVTIYSFSERLNSVLKGEFTGFFTGGDVGGGGVGCLGGQLALRF